MDVLKNLIEVRLDPKQADAGSNQRDQTGVQSDQFVNEEQQNCHSEGHQHAPGRERIDDGAALVHFHQMLDIGRCFRQLASEHEQQQALSKKPCQKDDGSQVRQEIHEPETGCRPDEDVGRITNQRSHTTDVGQQDLGHKKRKRRDTEDIGQGKRDRYDDDDGGDVVEHHGNY